MRTVLGCSEEKRSISILRAGNPCGHFWPPKYSEQPTCRFNPVNKQTRLHVHMYICGPKCFELRYQFSFSTYTWFTTNSLTKSIMFCGAMRWFALNPAPMRWKDRQKAGFIVSQFVMLKIVSNVCWGSAMKMSFSQPLGTGSHSQVEQYFQIIPNAQVSVGIRIHHCKVQTRWQQYQGWNLFSWNPLTNMSKCPSIRRN